MQSAGNTQRTCFNLSPHQLSARRQRREQPEPLLKKLLYSLFHFTGFYVIIHCRLHSYNTSDLGSGFRSVCVSVYGCSCITSLTRPRCPHKDRSMMKIPRIKDILQYIPHVFLIISLGLGLLVLDKH